MACQSGPLLDLNWWPAVEVVPAAFLRERMLQQPASGSVAGLHQA